MAPGERAAKAGKPGQESQTTLLVAALVKQLRKQHGHSEECDQDLTKLQQGKCLCAAVLQGAPCRACIQPFLCIIVIYVLTCQMSTL